MAPGLRLRAVWPRVALAEAPSCLGVERLPMESYGAPTHRLFAVLRVTAQRLPQDLLRVHRVSLVCGRLPVSRIASEVGLLAAARDTVGGANASLKSVH